MTTIGFKGFVPGVEQPVQAALESEETQVVRLMRQREIIKAYRAGLPRPPGPELQLHSGPSVAEEARTARLMRQRQIIKAYYEKRRAATEAVPLPVRERQGLAKAA